MEIKLNFQQAIKYLQEADRFKSYKNRFLILTIPINLYINNEKYLPSKPSQFSSEVMFFASVPNKREFGLIKQKRQYEVEMVDGSFRLYLTFENNGEDVNVVVEFVNHDEPIKASLKSLDLFSQFDKMWIDLVNVLYQLYPKEFVDQEMYKIYQKIDDRVAKGQV